MLIGYMRPVEDDPNCIDQLESLTTYHCNVIYTEELSSHKNKTTLKKMLLNLNKHDKIVVEKFYTIADSLKKLKEILNIIREKDAYILFIKENIDTSNVMEEKFNEYVQHLINLQGDIISENTKIGIKTAKNQGKNTGRPKKSLRNIQKAIDMYISKQFSLIEIQNTTGISKSSLYRYLSNWEGKS